MLHQAGPNSYHHSDTILFQFILYEFLKALEEADHIEKFCLKKLDRETYFQQITEYLVKLAGSEQEYMRVFSWVSDTGILTKLKNYCNLLSENTKKSDLTYVRLHECSYTAWADCMSVIDLIHKNETFKKIKAATEHSLSSIYSLIPVLEEALPKFKQDENVLFFLLRYKEDFDRLIEEGWTRKLFKKFYPRGASKFMTKQYHARGFVELLPEITHRLQQISR